VIVIPKQKRVDLVEIGWRVVAQDRYEWRADVNSVMSLRGP
jgi:hypothetical protein